MKDPLPPAVAALLWEIDPEDVDLERHSDYIMERVMIHGTWAAMRWLRETYSNQQLAGFLDRRATRLSPRDRAYWSVVSHRPAMSTPGGARPAWAGP